MSEELPDDIEIRPATRDDYDDVVAFTQDTWEHLSDYIPDVYHEWLDNQHDGRLTLVADAGDAIAGIAQGTLLSATEAWGQGLRVNPEFRGHGVGTAITERLFEWAREQGAVVMRNMVFSWNEAGLGQSRALGYEPATEFRWLHPEPDASRTPETVRTDVDAAWSFWTSSDVRTHLSGLGLDMDESWALREVTPAMLERAAEETTLFTVVDGGTRGMAYRTRTYDRENEDGVTETWAVYGVAAWEDLEAAATLLGAIAADAAGCGADRTRVLIPETARYVSDGALVRANIADEPDFVLSADLT